MYIIISIVYDFYIIYNSYKKLISLLENHQLINCLSIGIIFDCAYQYFCCFLVLIVS